MCNVSKAEQFVLSLKLVFALVIKKWSEPAEMQTKCLAKMCTRKHNVPLIYRNTNSAVLLCPNLKRLHLAEAELFGPKINDCLCSCLIRREVLCPG